MYDMTRVSAYGYFDVNDENARYAMKKQLSDTRTADYKKGYYSKPDMSASSASAEEIDQA